MTSAYSHGVLKKKSLRLYRHRKTNTTCSSQNRSMWKNNSNYGGLEKLGRRGRGGSTKNTSKRDDFQRWKAQQGNEVHNILPYVSWRTGWEELASIKELKKRMKPPITLIPSVHIMYTYWHTTSYFLNMAILHVLMLKKKIILVSSLATISMKHHRYFDLLSLNVV